MVNIPDELVAEARARGLEPEAYVEEILTRQADAVTGPRQLRSADEIRSWLDSLAQFSGKIPALPESISREWIYQDHD